ncbi:MAG: sigma-70 family RNA polymerase sigma factor [Sedimentisphaerales bacterium]|nr:sigma-70 family RNA polymerase sigma factor [Sedimentisphaerales bacterium]
MGQNAEHDRIERARKGDPKAVADLYRRYWRAARAAAYGVTADLALAEDAASEAFCEALEHLADLRDPQRFGPWLRTIAVRTARRLATARRKRSRVERETRPNSGTSAPAARLEQEELAGLIHEAVGSLPATLREALSLFYFEGYSTDEAARFLDVPVGTLKRRLHDARRRLRDAAEQILKGKRLMDPKREQILQHIRDFAEKGGDTEAFVQVMRQAWTLRPLPWELLRKVRQQHWGRVSAKLKEDEGRVQQFRRLMKQWSGPSERAQNPDDPVGAAARAIRAALPEFQTWQIDPSAVAESLLAGGASLHLPPRFAEGEPGSYLRATRGLVLLKPDGSLLTATDLVKEPPPKGPAQRQARDTRISDVLDLMWLRREPIELRSVEELLQHLVDAVAPETPARFHSLEEPQYRSALRLQLGDIGIPAALGGVYYRWPEIPEGTGIAHVRIFLEPWATARSGQDVELAVFTFPPHNEEPQPPSGKQSSQS